MVCLNCFLDVQVHVQLQAGNRTMFDSVSTGKAAAATQVRSGRSCLPPELFPVFSAERQQVLGALERLQTKLVQREEWSHGDAVGTLRQTLQSPLFSHILTLQQSIRQLRNQVRDSPPA